MIQVESSERAAEQQETSDATQTSSGGRRGFLIPSLQAVLPVMRRLSPLYYIKSQFPKPRRGDVIEAYVLTASLGAGIWLALVASGPASLEKQAAQVLGLVLIGVRVQELFFFLTKWLFVDRGTPDPARAILLFCLNLIELRFYLCVAAVLTSGIMPAQRWSLFFGAIDAGGVSHFVRIPYQMLTWLILALAVGALAGSLRSDAEQKAI